LVDALVQAFNAINEAKVVPLEKLAELCDPYSLVHEGYFVTHKGLHLANAIANDSAVIKPSTMSDAAVFISLGDDGGYSQALLRAYKNIVGAKGIYLKEKGVQQFVLKGIAKVVPDVKDILDVLFDVNDMEDETLMKMENTLDSLHLDAISSLDELVKDEAENGATLLIASKNIEQVDLWNQEIEFKPYFLYYTIAGLT